MITPPEGWTVFRDETEYSFQEDKIKRYVSIDKNGRRLVQTYFPERDDIDDQEISKRFQEFLDKEEKDID